MNRVDMLCLQDRRLLKRFSSECLIRLKEHLLFDLVLSLISDFLEANVKKEISKDRIIIEQAEDFFLSGRTDIEGEVAGVFERTKKIDAEYIEKARSQRFSFSLLYGDIEGIRKKRIRHIIETVTAFLTVWDEDRTFNEIVHRVFTREQFGERVFTFLHLYDLETRQLGNSVRIFLPAQLAKDMLIKKLYETMEKVSDELASDCVRKVFDG